MTTSISRGPYKPGRIREQSRDLILQAAEAEFACHGFRGATMQRIAESAQVPKANIHYYFSNKLGLYGAVLENTLNLWDTVFNELSSQDDPAHVLGRYIDAKMNFSRTNPTASRLFAKEMISGAPHLSAYLQQDYRLWFKQRMSIFESWIAQGKMDDLDPAHVIFMIWASTQYYADFEPQILIATEAQSQSEASYRQAANSIKHIILKGCGI
ncbi:MAG: TetR/AcrR family transcriptional regulator [Oceanospirillaceae bacterium]|jgi:TetR/AcrR family transcriptional regulator